MVGTAQSRESIEVLVVEDNPGDVRLVRYALAEADSWPVKLTVAEDGEKAINYLHQKGSFKLAERPDLVILDLNLPKCSGTEVLKVIRETEALKDIRVVILSSSPEDVIRNTVLNADVEPDCYFTKPPDFDEFLALGRKIRGCFEKRGCDCHKVDDRY